MEEMRSFGYICPHCGKAVLHQRSVFALSAAAARMECECGHEALEAEIFSELPLRQESAGPLI